MITQTLPSANLRRMAFAAGVFAMLTPAFAAGQLPGVPNFHEVNEQVYRGAQPTDEGFQSLAKIGIKTVIDLREPGDRSTTEEKAVKAAGMRYVSVPMRGLQAPTEDQLSRVLTLLDDKAAGPVFVHCRRGADRTGTVIACYRIGHDHWQNQKALGEAKSCGMSWIERAMQDYVRHYTPLEIRAGAAVPAVVTP